MESGMIIIAVVLFAVIAVPILLISINTKKKSATLLNGLNTLSSQNDGVLSQHIEHNNFALGADENKKIIYFFKKAEGVTNTAAIDLTTVKHCEISKTTSRIKKEKGVEEVIDKISLCFTKKNGQDTEYIDLYDENDSLQVNGELVIAENWKSIANQLIAHKTAFIQKQQHFKAVVS